MSFNLISLSTPPFLNSNSPWVIVGARLPRRTQLRSNSTSHLHVYPRASQILLLACPIFQPATSSQTLPYTSLQLTNAPTLLHGPCTLQHGDTFLRNVTTKYQKTINIMVSTGWLCHIPLKGHGVTGENGKRKKNIYITQPRENCAVTLDTELYYITG